MHDCKLTLLAVADNAYYKYCCILALAALFAVNYFHVFSLLRIRGDNEMEVAGTHS